MEHYGTAMKGFNQKVLGKQNLTLHLINMPNQKKMKEADAVAINSIFILLSDSVSAKYH